MPTTTYPNNLDVFSDPTPGTLENAISHSAQHAVANDAILALEQKLGVGAAKRQQAVAAGISSNQAVTPNLNNGESFRYTLSANITAVNAPTGLASGCLINFAFLQDGIGSRTVSGWSGVYVFSGPAPVLGSLPNAFDSITFWWDGSAAWEVNRRVGFDAVWSHPNLLNGWVDMATTFSLSGYKRFGDICYLRGRVRTGTMGSPIFILPPPWRPTDGDLLFEVRSIASNPGELQIRTDGTVTPLSAAGGTNQDFSLNVSYDLR